MQQFHLHGSRHCLPAKNAVMACTAVLPLNRLLAVQMHGRAGGNIASRSRRSVPNSTVPTDTPTRIAASRFSGLSSSAALNCSIRPPLSVPVDKRPLIRSDKMVVSFGFIV